MATIEIDGKTYEAQAGQMLIEVADANGIEIPRFCYHKKLSVSANCRMCLVEVEKAPKPLPACATPVNDGMKVFTRSTKALAAQKSVMEFLLINHPLDCPICDQGGECELQDIAVGYGEDVSRYQEEKRVVFSKNIGPLIATDMTRCIHCTRCVRFGQEIAGIQELGATGRGEHMLINTYVEKNVTSELSGNVIDLCPVGALTAKPSRFHARAWELQQRDSIAAHDSLGANIHVHVRRNDIMRVVPKENEAINEVWLADRDRFSYEGLQAEDRLTQPMIKQDGQWKETDWENALQVAADSLKKLSPSDIGGLASANATIEELYLFQKLLRGIGSQNIDHRLRQTDFSDQNDAPLFPYLGQAITDLENVDAALIIGSHIRKEQPLLNHRLRKASLKGGHIFFVNPVDYEFNFSVAGKMINADIVGTLAGIANALLGQTVTLLPKNTKAVLEGVTVSDEHKAMAESLLNTGSQRTVLLGQLAATHPQFATIRSLAAVIAKLTGATLGYLTDAANASGAWLAGVLPHRSVAGDSVEQAGLHANDMLSQALKGYVLLGIEPELDSSVGINAVNTLKQADCVVSLSAFMTPTMQEYANVILPIATFAETSGTYVNIEGQWQSFTGIVTPKGESRPAWKILRVLGNLFNLEEFDYTASDQIRDELRQQVHGSQANTMIGWQALDSLPETNHDGLQRITEMGIYATDAIVRRAPSLQNTTDTQTTAGVHLNTQTAQQAGVKDGQTVKTCQADQCAELTVVIDERVPDNCVLIYAGQATSAQLGAWYGQVTLK